MVDLTGEEMHWLNHEQVKKLYPCLSQFKDIQQQLDPRGIFLNGYLDNCGYR